MTIQILQHSSSSYGPRTYANAAQADVTIAIAVDYTTAGEKLTHKAAGDKYLWLPIGLPSITNARNLYKTLKQFDFPTRVINVAGNGIYTLHKHGYTQEEVNQYVFDILSKVHEFYPVEKVVSGGQTGIDLAGGVAGCKLGIETVMLLPKGYKQRGADMVDREHTVEEIMEQVLEGASKL